MICPDSDLDCDNPGCRHGGCQGRRPNLPLFRARATGTAPTMRPFEAATASGAVAITALDLREEGARRGHLAAA
jgi:hypothetical protein